MAEYIQWKTEQLPDMHPWNQALPGGNPKEKNHHHHCAHPIFIHPISPSIYSEIINSDNVIAQ